MKGIEISPKSDKVPVKVLSRKMHGQNRSASFLTLLQLALSPPPPKFQLSAPKHPCKPRGRGGVAVWFYGGGGTESVSLTPGGLHPG